MNPRHVALVTGAGRGIGEAIALRLAREGVAVLVAARSQEACIDVAAAIHASGGTAWPLHLDVSDADSVRDAMEEAHELAVAHGPIDWLVNNAGIAETAPFLAHGNMQGVDWYARHLDVNFHGPRRLVEALAPRMIQRGYGRIVNLGSSAALQGYAYASAYVASKHALAGYSRSVALELARTGVSMNLVCPHYVDSPMTDATVERIVKKTHRDPEATRSFLAAQNPGGTLVSVEEVADIVWQLASGDENGALVELIGGRGVRPLEETIVWRERAGPTARTGAR